MFLSTLADVLREWCLGAPLTAAFSSVSSTLRSGSLFGSSPTLLEGFPPVVSSSRVEYKEHGVLSPSTSEKSLLQLSERHLQD